MKKLMVMMSVLCASQVTWSQTSDVDLDQELDQIYKEADVKDKKNKVVAEDVEITEDVDTTSGVSSQPIYIVNQNKNAAGAANQAETGQVQQQPSTHIQASPLTESLADRLRKNRQDAEVQTELKLVERLEQSRIEDEKRRAKALFDGGFKKIEQQPVAPVVVMPQPASSFQNNEDASINVKEEIRAAISDLRNEDEIMESSTFFGGAVGFGDYPGAVNVRGNISAGFALGTTFEDRIITEMDFVYGNYDVEDVFEGTYNGLPLIKAMDQYSLSGAFKYQLLGGRMRPALGVIASYSYRTYSDTQYYISVNNDTHSHAIDIGVAGSVDVKVTDRFTISGEYRYLWNVWHRTSDVYQRSFVNQSVYAGKPLEEFSRYVFLLSGRLSF